MTVEFRKAIVSDAAEISAVMWRYVDMPWTKAQVKEEIENPDALFFTAVADGKVVGFLSGVCAADECEISDVAVEQMYRRQGIATSLFELLLSNAKTRGARTAFLLVRDDNIPAIKLYRSLAFSDVGRRKGYYNGIDAVIMRRDL